jgi:hypothetical protein
MGIKKSSLLLKHLNAKRTFLGDIVFNFAGDAFRLARIATGGGISSVGGSYPVLEAYTRPCPRLIIGNESSGKFTKGKFLILPKHKIIQVRDMNVLVGSDDSDLMIKVEKFLSDNPFIVPVLFNKPFSHLTVASRIDVGGWSLLQRKTVLNYTGLPESIYENPQEFEIFLKSVLLLKHYILTH